MIMERNALAANPYQPVGFDPPDVIDPDKVGAYDVLVKSGGGMFYDEVLEYRVWCHPHCGAPPAKPNNHSDYYCAFATYADALKFACETPGAEEPLVLVKQREWVHQLSESESEEANTGANRYVRRAGERIAEWRVEWLRNGPRKENDIEKFLAHGMVEG